MSEEKKTPAQESKVAKVLTWFKLLPGRIAKPFKNMVAELKKVTWPSKKKWISSSVMVLVFMLFMGVVIGLLDLGATSVVQGLVGATHNTAVVENVDETVETVDENAAVEDSNESAE